MCFYNGLDTYLKVWLKFVFPAYLITILFVVIIMSKYSSMFAKVIGKRNPIATLATLILLSYMKFLRNIIDVFSVADLRYTDGSNTLASRCQHKISPRQAHATFSSGCDNHCNRPHLYSSPTNLAVAPFSTKL